MREIKVFVSSPGDAQFERRRLERVVERLNGELHGAVRLQVIRWERSFYQAHTSFQAQIPEAAACDIVIGILRHRLGTELPPDFPKMPNGDPYPSGTAYEVLSAIEARRTKDLPDVFVFRSSEPPTVQLDDPAQRALVETQWQRLMEFFSTWFMAPDGGFKAAFQTFRSTDDFETQVEALLRAWIADHVLKGRAVVWPIEVRGSPFRGLDAFGARHAPVFFGRSRDIARSVEQIKDASETDVPFLLVVGPSGSGKSSLARAGLIPRLTAPGVVPRIDVWRVAAMRPSERGADVFLALAEQLLKPAASIEADETGRAPALPEIAESSFRAPRDLADLLFHADPASIKPILHALEMAAEAERVSGGYDRKVRSALLVLVDQLDELFATDIPEDARNRFATLLAEMVGSGRIWVVVTLRADLYERYGTVPALLALKRFGATYDLAPPGPAELGEIVRRPAEATGLIFEANAAGRTLDERLLADVDRADMLPLLQFTLERLFRERVADGDEVRLTHAAYDAIGGLDGAIDKEAERALGALGEAEIARLPRLLRELAAPARSGEDAPDAMSPAPIAIRAVPLARAAHDPEAERLVDALVDARILLASGAEGAATVRVAHQRVIESWKRARDIVAENSGFFRIREEVEGGRRRWEAGGRRRTRLLPSGVPLAEAESLVRRFPAELSPETRAFVAASGNRARLRQRLVAAAAIVFLGVALAAGYFGWRAREEEQRAERNFAVATGTLEGVFAEMAEGLQDVEGVPIESREHMLKAAQAAADPLFRAAPDDPVAQRIRAALQAQFGDLALLRGDSAGARVAYDEGLQNIRRLATQEPDDWRTQGMLALLLGRIGDLKVAEGDLDAALASYDEALEIARRNAAQAPNDPQLMHDLALALENIGAAQGSAGDAAAERQALDESIDVRRDLVALDAGNTGYQRDLSVVLIRIGDQEYSAGDMAAALAAYDEALAIRRGLAEREPNNTLWQAGVATALDGVAAVRLAAAETPQALEAYQKALTIRRRLVRLDPANTEWQRAVSVSLDNIAGVMLEAGNAGPARTFYEESLQISRDLVKVDPVNVQWRHDVAVGLNKVGGVKRLSGDTEGALAAYRESLDVFRQLANQEPPSATWQNSMAVGLDRIADMDLDAGRSDAARAGYEEALAIFRRLSEADPENAEWQRNVAVSLNQVGDLKVNADKAEAGMADYREALEIVRKLVERDPENAIWQWDLVIGLYKVGHASADGDQADYLRQAVAAADKLEERGALTPDQVSWSQSLRSLLVGGGDAPVEAPSAASP